jgi:hypothetical protein
VNLKHNYILNIETLSPTGRGTRALDGPHETPATGGGRRFLCAAGKIEPRTTAILAVWKSIPAAKTMVPCRATHHVVLPQVSGALPSRGRDPPLMARAHPETHCSRFTPARSPEPPRHPAGVQRDTNPACGCLNWFGGVSPFACKCVWVLRS